MLLAYVMLTTFYGANRAYIAISWLPLAFLLTIWVFIQLMQFQHLSDQWWRDLAGTIGWASLFQTGLGMGLITRTLWRRERAIGLSLATLLSLSPFFARLLGP
jgi:hypothetical protein